MSELESDYNYKAWEALLEGFPDLRQFFMEALSDPSYKPDKLDEIYLENIISQTKID